MTIEFSSKTATVKFDAAKTTATEIIGRLQAKSKYKDSKVANVGAELEALGAHVDIAPTIVGRAVKLKVSFAKEDKDHPITRIAVKLAKGPAGVKDSGAPTSVGSDSMTGTTLEHVVSLGDKVKGEIAILIEVKLAQGKSEKTLKVVVPVIVG